MTAPLSSSSRLQRGFSLIELMVGMVLAMIAAIVVMQLFQQSERSNRTTAGTSSVAMDGAIAITEIQRAARQAGQGFISDDLLGCGLTLVNGFSVANLAPVTINSASVHAGDPNTDTLLIVYGTGVGGPEGDRVTGTTGLRALNVLTVNAFKVNDYVVPAPDARAATCSLALNRVGTVTGVAPTGSVGLTADAAGSPALLFNFGTAPRVLAFAVRKGRLSQCDYMLKDCSLDADDSWVGVYDGVVSLRAQYGHSNTVPPTYDQATPATAANWRLVDIVRVALTLRSGQLEDTSKGDVTSVAPTWAGSGSTPIELKDLPVNWKAYRYRVYEAVIPLRNVANLNS